MSNMESIIRNVRDIETDERRALEHVIGKQLKENQQIIIQVVTLGSDTAEEEAAAPSPSDELPSWCNVYEGLTDKGIDDLESVILQRANLTRPTP